MTGKIYGYARVSTREQNEDRQMIALTEAGVDAANIFVDKQSGKDFDRPEYLRLTRRLKRGDLLVVKSIDRLGRNYRDIQDQWRMITKVKGADIMVLDMPLLDTRAAKDLVGTLISDLVLQLLSFVAENERDNIRARQAEGIAAAKARGVRFGPAPKPLPPNFEAVAASWNRHEIPLATAAKMCGMARSSFHAKAVKMRDQMHLGSPEKSTTLDCRMHPIF